MTSWAASKEGGQQGEEGDCLLLLGSSKAPPGELPPHPGLPAQEECGPVEAGPIEGCEHDQRAVAPLL